MSSLHTQFGGDKIWNHILYPTSLIALEMSSDKEGATVDTVFYLPLIYVPDPKKSKNVIFSPWGHKNIHNDVVQPVQTPEHPKCLFQPKWPKCPWSTLGWSKVKQGQNRHKTTFFMGLYQTRALRRFLETLTKFDSELTPNGTKNPNFDPAIKTGWN